ncbi:MAG: methyl-accepting chemotaxis protein [Gammaproteobacteria bacterium]|nr:methyl-accepting chemotaxis protein [Gammaproteobacteria bacterium]MDH5593689.1 methyl-accepting chemotaxis protein [Gammaproteobacteria bacterium]
MKPGELVSKYRGVISRENLNKIGGDNPDFIFFSGLMVFSLIAMFIILIYASFQESYDKERLGYIDEQRVLSQSVIQQAMDASLGNEKSFAEMETVLNKYQETVDKLVRGNKKTGLPDYGSNSVLQEADYFWENWSLFRTQVETVSQSSDSILKAHQSINNINTIMPRLVALNNNVVDTLVKKSFSQSLVHTASNQLLLLLRMELALPVILRGGADSAVAADSFGRDIVQYLRVMKGMLNGDSDMGIQRINDADIRNQLNEISILFASVKDISTGTLALFSEVTRAQDAVSVMVNTGQHIVEDANVLKNDYLNDASRRIISPALGVAFAIIAVVVLGILGYLVIKSALKREEEAKKASNKNEEAIFRLLDEMGDLADGDLTVNITVTDDFTGTIADSINYTIDALRNLVNSINQTTEQVTGAAEQSRETAVRLAQASDQQAGQIASASTSINEMAVSIEDVSKNAGKLAEEAQESVRIASEGAGAVRDTIEGMDNLRENIQETSKRIKRLGESSQEIGEIVELINDIADQTNILALNAAIQAAMAGDAGRGFAVVADEVQRLAERSGNATKQIEALVKTIQTDTNEAVISMEQSTSNVVRNAQLSQNAGSALSRIEEGSTHLAELIQDISNSSHQQSQAATSVSETMNLIQEITNQTSAGTNETAASIGNLAELANELRTSVAGFKLPH